MKKLETINKISVLFFIFAAVTFCFGQKSDIETAKIVNRNVNRINTVASGNNLYCAGFIQTGSVNPNLEIVGGIEEQEQYNYVNGDYVYISVGANQGVKVGDLYSVIRPKGKFKTVLSSKGNLGIFVQEIGSLEIVKVKQDVSVAVVKVSCDSMFLGDLLQPAMKRTSPTLKQNADFDQFSDDNGKVKGKIVLARDGQEMVSRDQIVYVDLGAEDNVKAGDYLTVYRPLGQGNIVNHKQNEAMPTRKREFGSDQYKGGYYTNSGTRKAGENADGKSVTSGDAMKDRPKNIRKVVGELVILNVKEKTATAVVTRTLQEIHTGDSVELQ